MKIQMAILVALVSLLLGLDARAEDTFSTIDLTAFDGGDGLTSSDTLADHLHDVSFDGGVPVVIRPYVSGIAGVSFGTLVNSGQFESFPADVLTDVLSVAGTANQAMFTGGGAIGAAIARPYGQLRSEVEGRARGPIGGTAVFQETGYVPYDANIVATGGWSTLVNFWRDLDVNDRLGLYLGGGFGVGGYQLNGNGMLGLPQSVPANTQMLISSTVTTFAWQVGTGVTYRWSERITLDVGYRFFAMTPATTTYLYRQAATGYRYPAGTFSSALSASELLVSIRIYEPLRGLVR